MKLYATSALGTADVVAGELKALGFAGVRWDAGGVHFEAGGDPLDAAMRACLELRAALRVLWPLAHGRDDVYAVASQVAWEEHLDARTTFAVGATTAAPPPLAHAPFLAQRVKDAIVDRLRARLGARPDVSRDDPDLRVYVHVAEDGKVDVGLDASGGSLHQRGYRVAQTPAPLRETLAAAVVALTGWDGTRPWVDPMCGSGTLVIEAALRAMRVAPGALDGRRFGFERWPAFGDAARARWTALRDAARARMLERAPAALVGRDRDPDAVAAARANAARLPAAVAAAIRLEVGDARELAATVPPGVVVSNPPYGERLDAPGVRAFWRMLGATLRRLDGHTAFLLYKQEMLRDLGMRPSWERRLKNGPLTVTLGRFELGRAVGGARRAR